MKNTSKIFGFIALMAVIALSMAFTSCDFEDAVWTYTFTNASLYDIVVTCADLTPSSLTIEKMPAGDDYLLADPKMKTATGGAPSKIKSALLWSAVGLNSTTDRDRQVKVVISGTGWTFEKNEEEGMANIKPGSELDL
jgi:hypothetical protein